MIAALIIGRQVIDCGHFVDVKKKIPYVNERGEKCEPQWENGLKFETLAVDLISFMGSVLPCEVRREKEFATALKRRARCLN